MRCRAGSARKIVNAALRLHLISQKSEIFASFSSRRSLWFYRLALLHKLKQNGGGHMSAKFTDLHCKEVICISNGQRLGMIEDVIIQLPKGEITAIVVPGRCKLGGLAGPRDDFVIPWCNICRIGPDIVLVDIKPDDCRVLRTRPKLMF